MCALPGQVWHPLRARQTSMPDLINLMRALPGQVGCLTTSIQNSLHDLPPTEVSFTMYIQTHLQRGAGMIEQERLDRVCPDSLHVHMQQHANWRQSLSGGHQFHPRAYRHHAAG